MIGPGLLAALLAQATPATPAQTQPLAVPPRDWSTLPELKLQRIWRDQTGLSDFVRDEVRAGRCSVTTKEIRVDLAVHVTGDGQVRRIIPRAIDCPTVEQYASGLMSRMARGNVVASGDDAWFRATLIFAWP